MLTRFATEAGDDGNEDYAVVGDSTVVVLDGLTARTETGCIHGVRWYVERLAKATLAHAGLGSAEALVATIKDTVDQHRDTCDLTHPGTPAAAVAIAITHATATELRYLVLCDTTIVLDTTAGIAVVTDSRMGRTAPAERAAATASQRVRRKKRKRSSE